MFLRSLVPNKNRRFSLQIDGAQDEYGRGEHVFAFEDHLVSLTDDVDVCSIEGLLIDSEGSDTCVRIRTAHERAARGGWFDIAKGAAAQSFCDQNADIRVRVRGESVLFLHSPLVHDISEDKLPGTRLIASLRKYFVGTQLEVVLDLGTPDGDPSFRNYLFSVLHLLDLHFLDHRLASGQWGRPKERKAGTYAFTAIYD